MLTHQLLGRQREQALTTVASDLQAQDPVERWSEVIARALPSCAGVQGDSDT